MSENATVLRAASCSLQLEPTYYDPRAGEALYLIVFKGFGWIWLDANIQKIFANIKCNCFERCMWDQPVVKPGQEKLCISHWYLKDLVGYKYLLNI